MSRAVGKPVRVQWMREDEHGWEPKGPAQLITVRAGVDAQGNVDRLGLSWIAAFRGPNHGHNPLLAVPPDRHEAHKPRDSPTARTAAAKSTRSTIRKCRWPRIFPGCNEDPTPLRTSNLRAPGDLARVFASESFIDEIAAGPGVDPVQFRLQLPHQRQARHRSIRSCHARSEPDGRSGPRPHPIVRREHAVGRGVAVANRANTMTAAVAEVEVDKATAT